MGMIQNKECLVDVQDMRTEELTSKIKQVLGLDYDWFYQEDMHKLAANNKFLANWKREDFKHIVGVDIVEGMDALKCDGEIKEEGFFSKLNDSDKLALQTYGRPYANGKPGGVFYKYARVTAPLPLLRAAAASKSRQSKVLSWLGAIAIPICGCFAREH